MRHFPIVDLFGNILNFDRGHVLDAVIDIDIGSDVLYVRNEFGLAKVGNKAVRHVAEMQKLFLYLQKNTCSES